MPAFEDEGWLHVLSISSSTEAEEILRVCHQLCAGPEPERRGGDKPHGGTRHLVELDARSELVDEVVGRAVLTDAVSALLGDSFSRLQVSYRSPQPGFGAQKLHADALPKLDDGPDLVATAIIPLIDFTPVNGPTRVVPGSHRRPDLQRIAGNLDSHPDEMQLLGPAGSAFVFSGHLLHSGTRNESTAERPALQLQWKRSA